MRSNTQETADFVTFTEEILNGKLLFLCRVRFKAMFFGISFVMIHSLEAKAYFYLMLVNGVVEGVHRRQENAFPF